MVFSQKKYSSEKNKLPAAVIFDVDGTLTVGPHHSRSPYDYDMVHMDHPNHIIIELAIHHKKMGREILIVTGRDESCRKNTIEWLDFYNVPYDKLFMRPDGVVKKDSYVKKEIFTENIHQKYNVLCVIDDRLSVLEMWNSLGVYTFNVNQFQKLF